MRNGVRRKIINLKFEIYENKFEGAFNILFNFIISLPRIISTYPSMAPNLRKYISNF